MIALFRSKQGRKWHLGRKIVRARVCIIYIYIIYREEAGRKNMYVLHVRLLFSNILLTYPMWWKEHIVYVCNCIFYGLIYWRCYKYSYDAGYSTPKEGERKQVKVMQLVYIWSERMLKKKTWTGLLSVKCWSWYVSVQRNDLSAAL